VLRWSDGSTITMKEAIDECGFASTSLWTGVFKKDATAIEEDLQRHCQHLPLGVRLWRCVAKGAKSSDDDVTPRVYQVFLTFAYDVVSDDSGVVVVP
jgi:hypothetical protein